MYIYIYLYVNSNDVYICVHTYSNLAALKYPRDSKGILGPSPRIATPFADRSGARHFVEKTEATFLDAAGTDDQILGMENKAATARPVQARPCHACQPFFNSEAQLSLGSQTSKPESQ